MPIVPSIPLIILSQSYKLPPSVAKWPDRLRPGNFSNMRATEQAKKRNRQHQSGDHTEAIVAVAKKRQQHHRYPDDRQQYKKSDSSGRDSHTTMNRYFSRRCANPTTPVPYLTPP